MKFEAGQQFYWRERLWEIRLVEDRIVTLKMPSTGEWLIESQSTLESAYRELLLKPKTESEVSENPFNGLIWSDLSEKQRKTIQVRRCFLEPFLNGLINNSNAKAILQEIADELGIEKPYGESTVRRWQTLLKKNGGDFKSLVDKRSHLHK